MDTSLEWKIVIGRRRFVSGHSTLEGEEESWKNQVIDFMRRRDMADLNVGIIGSCHDNRASVPFAGGNL